MWLDFLREDELDRDELFGVPWTPELRASFAETYKKLIELGCDTEDVRGSLIAGMRARLCALRASREPTIGTTRGPWPIGSPTGR